MEHAMHLVEENCSEDVSSLCTVPEDVMTLRSDPFMRMNHMHMDHVLHDSLTVMLNHMMDTAVRVANEQPTYLMISVDESRATNRDAIPKPAVMNSAPERVFDSMIYDLAESVASSSSEEEEASAISDEEESTEEAPAVWDPVVFSKHLIEHGEQAMAQAQAEGDENRHRLARRLTEVRPGMFHQGHHGAHGPHLPFGCRKNHCLMSAYEQGVVSPRCADALRQVEEENQIEVSHEKRVVEREQETFLGLAILYGILCIGTLFLLHRRLTKLGRKMRGKHRLKRRILQAVYNNPEIKAAIADELDEDLGHVPPLPPHVLARMSGKEFPTNWRMMRALKLLVLTGVLVLAFVNPLLAMPVMCILIGVRFIHLAFCPPTIPKQECSCCCCGATTEDVANGTLTAAQECCTCCKSTGVCSPNCAACCGDGSKGCCCCCGDGGCCCCGATSADAAAGKLTDAQACCCCCQGTGVCAGSGCGCCCCCGGSCCCSDKSSSKKRPVRYAKEKAYMGIPVQVV